MIVYKPTYLQLYLSVIFLYSPNLTFPFPDVGDPMSPSEWRWSHSNRVLVSGGVFSEYLVTPARDSLVIIDGRSREVQCEWQDITHANVIVWVKPRTL